MMTCSTCSRILVLCADRIRCHCGAPFSVTAPFLTLPRIELPARRVRPTRRVTLKPSWGWECPQCGAGCVLSTRSEQPDAEIEAAYRHVFGLAPWEEVPADARDQLCYRPAWVRCGRCGASFQTADDRPV